jgi:hypothetical protein
MLGPGVEHFAKSDGLGNLIQPLPNRTDAINLLLYPENDIPEEGFIIF